MKTFSSDEKEGSTMRVDAVTVGVEEGLLPVGLWFPKIHVEAFIP